MVFIIENYREQTRQYAAIVKYDVLRPNEPDSDKNNQQFRKGKNRLQITKIHLYEHFKLGHHEYSPTTKHIRNWDLYVI